MIITQLSGGLGNQMFQYALGRVLSLKNDNDLVFDLSAYTDQKNCDTPRKYELDIFGIEPIECTHVEKVRYGDENPLIEAVNRACKTHLDSSAPTLVKERGHQFHKELLQLRGSQYLRGFWQSEKYFVDYRDQILHDFTFKHKVSQKTGQLLLQIKSSDSVAVHIRRGDYVTSKAANSYHGTCSPTYYLSASKVMGKHVAHPTFYIFSDDPDWCRDNIKLNGNFIYVSHNHGQQSWEDMLLISRCQHQIIANSSFSWWGAWLNTNPDKIVIAPKKWVNDKNLDTSDLLPGTWIKL
ncbi:MAG: alpha-1,2-fucosyltransferase [bacterium]